MKIYALISILLVSVLLLGCLNSPAAPVEQNTLNSTPLPNSNTPNTQTNTTTQTSATQSESKTLTYDSAAFSIQYPADWKFEELNDDTSNLKEVIFTPVEQIDGELTGLTISYQTYTTRAPPTLKEMHVIELNKANDYVTVISNEEVQFQGQTAVKATFQITASALKGTTQTDYLFNKGSTTFGISALYKENDSTTKQKVDAMLQTFQTK